MVRVLLVHYQIVQRLDGLVTLHLQTIRKIGHLFKLLHVSLPELLLLCVLVVGGLESILKMHGSDLSFAE